MYVLTITYQITKQKICENVIWFWAILNNLSYLNDLLNVWKIQWVTTSGFWSIRINLLFEKHSQNALLSVVKYWISLNQNIKLVTLNCNFWIDRFLDSNTMPRRKSKCLLQDSELHQDLVNYATKGKVAKVKQCIRDGVAVN